MSLPNLGDAAFVGQGQQRHEEQQRQRRYPSRSPRGARKPVLGLVALGLLFIVIFIGFPIAFTLGAMAIATGFIALGPRIFDLAVLQTFSVILKGVVPQWELKQIYAGMMQFMVLQIIGVGILLAFPQLATWLPKVMGQ